MDRVPSLPETLRPELSEGALKCPIFQTSTFTFHSAAEGKAFFEVAYGLRAPRAGETPGLIYSRINHPNLEILERRLCLWDRAEAGAVFESGMAAITTTMLELLRPGDTLLYSDQLYGGTDHFVRHVLPRFGIRAVPFPTKATRDELCVLIDAENIRASLALIFVETPANPTNALVDIRVCAEAAARCSTDDRRVLVAVDNTFLGPLWQHPLAHGADLVLYSATKYIGGHSDVVAGACLGSAALIERVRAMRTFLGTMASPWTAWLLLRSLETLKVRMEQQLTNAERVVSFLAAHERVTRVYYPGRFPRDVADAEVYARQCAAPGAMIAFEIDGGETEAFAVLDAFALIKLAVSLGGTESLAEHPATMTHADVPPEVKAHRGISPGLIRLSVGIENVDDLLADLGQALGRLGR